MDKANRTRVPKLMLVGAISFGRPDTLLHAFRGLQVQFVGRANHNGGDAFDALRLICRYQMGRHRRSPPRRIGLPMLAGVWLLGECS